MQTSKYQMPQSFLLSETLFEKQKNICCHADNKKKQNDHDGENDFVLCLGSICFLLNFKHIPVVFTDGAFGFLPNMFWRDIGIRLLL